MRGRPGRRLPPFPVANSRLPIPAARTGGVPMSTDPLRILIFGAHPDDCDLRCGGMALKWRALGHEVKFISMANGDTGHHEMGGGPVEDVVGIDRDRRHAGRRVGEAVVRVAERRRAVERRRQRHHVRHRAAVAGCPSLRTIRPTATSRRPGEAARASASRRKGPARAIVWPCGRFWISAGEAPRIALDEAPLPLRLHP